MTAYGTSCSSAAGVIRWRRNTTRKGTRAASGGTAERRRRWRALDMPAVATTDAATAFEQVSPAPAPPYLARRRRRADRVGRPRGTGAGSVPRRKSAAGRSLVGFVTPPQDARDPQHASSRGRRIRTRGRSPRMEFTRLDPDAEAGRRRALSLRLEHHYPAPGSHPSSPKPRRLGGGDRPSCACACSSPAPDRPS